MDAWIDGSIDRYNSKRTSTRAHCNSKTLDAKIIHSPVSVFHLISFSHYGYLIEAVCLS